MIRKQLTYKGILDVRHGARLRHGSLENLVAEPDEEYEVPEEEEDARAVVLERSKATRGASVLLDFPVKAFAEGVGQTANEVVE